MELVERLREIAADFHQARYDNTAKQIREAADLLEEALKALEPFAPPVVNLPTLADYERVRAILTKSQGEKIDG